MWNLGDDLFGISDDESSSVSDMDEFYFGSDSDDYGRGYYYGSSPYDNDYYHFKDYYDSDDWWLFISVCFIQEYLFFLNFFRNFNIKFKEKGKI